MSLKRITFKKRQDEFDSGPCFEIGPDVQLKEIPTTGEEYLLKVITERQNSAKISKYEDYSKLPVTRSFFEEEVSPAKVPEKLKPTAEWQKIQVADFSEVRMYISRMLANKSLWPNDAKKVKAGHFSSDDWNNFFNIKEPTLSCVLGVRCDIVAFDFGLEHLVEMLNKVTPGETIDYKTGQWIYAFLACVNQPLLSDTCNTLRNLGKKCAEIRSHLNPDDENVSAAVAPLNIFICIVSRYFLQLDLSD